jgi:hypothetical protein
MTMKTYAGSCHCGAVRFEAEMDLSDGTKRCNCSICTKSRAWYAIVPATQVRVLKGEEALSDYQWIAPGNSEPHLHYHFCKTCGVRAFAYGEPPEGKPFYAIAIAALDNLDPEAVANSIRYLDGRHNRYDRAPDDTRVM